MCPDFFPGCFSGSHCCLRNALIFTCVCTMQAFRTWSMGVGMFHRSLIKAAAHHQYIVPNMCSSPSIHPSSFPAGLQCDPVQIAEVVQQEYKAWLYSRVNTVHLWKHHSYCLQRQNRGRKDRPPEHHLIANDRYKWITNTTNPQYAHIIPWCQWSQSLRVLHFFPAV